MLILFLRAQEEEEEIKVERSLEYYGDVQRIEGACECPYFPMR